MMRAYSMMFLMALGLALGCAGYSRADDDDDDRRERRHEGRERHDRWKHEEWHRGKHHGWDHGKHKGWQHGKHKGWQRNHHQGREHWDHRTSDPAHQTVHDDYELRALQREQQRREILRNSTDWRQRQAALDQLNHEAYQDWLGHRQYHRDNNLAPLRGPAPVDSYRGGYYRPYNGWSPRGSYAPYYYDGYRGWPRRGD